MVSKDPKIDVAVINAALVLLLNPDATESSPPSSRKTPAVPVTIRASLLPPKVTPTLTVLFGLTVNALLVSIVSCPTTSLSCGASTPFVVKIVSPIANVPLSCKAAPLAEASITEVPPLLPTTK